MSITRPQLTISQLLQTSAAVADRRIKPIVIGPQYLLSRYGVESDTPGYDFDSAGQNINYQYRDSAGDIQTLSGSNIVDQDNVRLYAEGLEASLATFSTLFQLDDVSTPNVLKLTGGTYVKVGSGSLATLLRGRPVQVGDLAYVTDTDSTVRRRRVTGLRGVDVAATIGTNNDKDDGKAANSAYNPTTSTAAFTSLSAPSGMTIALASGSVASDYDALVDGSSLISGQYGDEFTLTVSVAGAPGTAAVNISSRSGIYSAQDVATVNVSGDYEVTDASLCGISVLLSDGVASALTVGQQFQFRIIGGYSRLDTTNATVGNRHFKAAGTFTGPRDTTYLVKVLEGTAAGSGSATGGVVQVSDSSGLEVATEVTLTENVAFNLGTYGLTATFVVAAGTPTTQDGLRAGDVYYINAVAEHESDEDFDKVVFDGPVADTTVTGTGVDLVTEFRLAYTGIIARDASSTGDAWAPTATYVDVESALSLFVDERSASYKWVAYVDGVGELFPYFRAVVPPASGENKIAINDVSDIEENFGPVDIDNDLAYGLSRAFSGAQGLTTYGLRTAGLTNANFTAAFKKIEATDTVYALAVLTDDPVVKASAVSHVAAMSQPGVKNFRRVYLGIDSPGEYVKLDEQGDGNPYTATIADYGGTNILVTFQQDVDLTLLSLVEGDILRLTSDEVDYEIASVLSETELLLVAGPVSPLSPAVPVQVWKADTAESQTAYIAAASQALANRRAVHVWTEDGTTLASDGSAVVVPNKFVACEVAGLRCALLPQEGLTRTEVTSITSAPAMYTRYTQDQLDVIANAGTFIVTQDAETSDVYIRHQLTTETDKGSLYYEDNVGVIIDDVSFDLKDVLDPYIGKKNVTTRTLQLVKNATFEILLERTLTDADADESLTGVGPALIKFTSPTVTVHATIKDRIKVYSLLTIPLPLNNIDVVLEAETDTTLAGATA